MNVPEQHAERDGGRADHQLDQLEPDDLVDQRGAAAADEQQQQQREKSLGRREGKSDRVRLRLSRDRFGHVRTTLQPPGELACAGPARAPTLFGG